MSGVNKVILVGRLGKDPEVRHLENGMTVANFSMATSETYKDRVTGEKREQTEWHNVVFWRGLAEVAEKYLKKGDMIYTEGKLRTRSWEKDGVTRYTTDIVSDRMTMLGGGDNLGGNMITQENTLQQQPDLSSNTPAPAEDASDDLPF